jgi:hypothetical protein
MAFLEISRRTDILALAAFLISLSGLLYQVSMFVRGPVVTLYPPQQVLIFADTPSPGSEAIVRFNARMTYVNTGEVGHNVVVKKERLTFKLGDEKLLQEWESFTTAVPRGSELTWNKQDDAHPVPVNAKSSESHQTSFTPYPVRGIGQDDNRKFAYYLSWDEFIQKLARQEKLELEWVAEIYGSSKVHRATCWLEFDQHTKAHLAQKKWEAMACWP